MSCETCAAACPAAKGARTSGGQGAGVAVALLGQPNSGKSTLFNGLTGARQHVGNWPGKTVERKEGSFGIGDTQCRVVDLPGAYGLSANSPEEEVTRDYLESGDADVVVVMADASQLQRSLYMGSPSSLPRTRSSPPLPAFESHGWFGGQGQAHQFGAYRAAARDSCRAARGVTSGRVRESALRHRANGARAPVH